MSNKRLMELYNNKKIVLIPMLLVIALTILISGCSYNTKSPKIELSTKLFDLGDIHPDNGNRVETFFVKNIGNAPLEILSVSTSCGCTKAEVEADEIPAGSQTKLIVSYDPSVHPDLIGKIQRVVYIKSNDPLQEEVELELIGNSLPSKPKEESEHEDDIKTDFEISPFKAYSVLNANDTVKFVDVREEPEYARSHIKNALLLSFSRISEAELTKLSLKEEDYIVLYDNSGRLSARAYEIFKSLGYKNVKSIVGGLAHWTEEGFPIEKNGVSTEQPKLPAENAPNILFDKTAYNFGKIPQFGGIVNTTFQVMNSGQAELKINSITTSCGCVSADLDKKLIKPAESATLTVFFNPNLHEEPKGVFTRTIFLETNDPQMAEAELKIFIDILEGQ